MKQGWVIKRLEEVADFQRGLTYSKKDEVDFSDNIVLRSNNIDLLNNKLDFTELKYVNPSIVIPDNKMVKRGSLLICTANGSKSHLGKVALIDKDYNYAFGGFMGQITPKQKLDSRFLFYLMTSDNYKKFINELSDGANINNLKFSDLGQFEIPLPPLPEQQHIVSILDEAFAAIAKAKANAEQNLRNAKELFESYLQGVFEKKGEGWEEKRIDEICKLINGRAYKKDELLNKGKYRVLRVGNFFTSDHWYYSDLELDEDKYCDKEDLLYAWSASFGPRIWKEEKVIYHYHIWKVIPDENLVTRDFLFTLFEWDKEKIKAAQGTGTTMIHVSKGSMENRIVPVPPLKEQQNIVRQLDALRAETQKLEVLYQKKIADLEELKKSILQKAFAGELETSDAEVKA